MHVVASLSHGGLERLVIDWTNARNERYPSSTEIICLDELGDMAPLVDGGHVACLAADRSKFPWDRATVRRLRGMAEGGKVKAEERAEGGKVKAEMGERGDESDLSSACPGSPSSAFTFHPSSFSPIFHSHNLAAQQYAALACFGARTRHVHTEHGSKEHVSGWKNRLRNRLLARLTDHVVAVSEAVADAMVLKEGVPRRLISVIPNGIAEPVPPRDETVAVLRSELGIPGDAVVIGTVGRLAEVKGQDRLIAAFAAISRRAEGGKLKAEKGGKGDEPDLSAACSDSPSVFSFHPSSLCLLLIGDGPARAGLEQQARDLGIADYVIFAGYRADARELISVMDLFVLPSRSEGLPVALLEAMASGVPVMATDAGESWAVIEEGGCGVKLPDDEKQWSDSFSFQLSALSTQTTQERVEKAKRRVKEQYSLEATLDGYERIYGVLTRGSEKFQG